LRAGGWVLANVSGVLVGIALQHQHPPTPWLYRATLPHLQPLPCRRSTHTVIHAAA
jgi:hypothetical protein